MVQWLDDDEQRAWRAMIDVTMWLHACLDADLLSNHELSEGGYGVLVALSEAPGRAMRMCDLAMELHLSPSGLTRRLDGLVKRELVTRRPADDDRRATMAVLTDRGYEVLEAAAPAHVESVRRNFFDHLTREQVRQLGDALERIRSARTAAEQAAN